MGQVGSSTGERIATTIIGGVIAAPPSYLVGKIVEKWGILDPIADKIGEWLKINVPASAVGWFVALLIFSVLYGLMLWRIWRPRHVYDTELRESVSLGDSYEAEIEPPGLNRFYSPTVTQTPPTKLTEVEREKIAATICDVVDFVGEELTPFYNRLNQLDSSGPQAIIEAADELETKRCWLAQQANEMWHKRRYYLDQIKFDLVPMMQTLDALRNPLLNAAEAKDWPTAAQSDRARPIAQLLSDVGAHVGNLNRIAEEKRREFLE